MMKHYSLITTLFSALMVFVYAGVGVLFLFFPNFAMYVTGSSRYIMGIALILYAGFRVYRIYREKNEKNVED